jgi:hypothetical protein
VNLAYGPYVIALERRSHVPAPSNDERPLRMFMTDYRPAAHKVERLGCQSPGRKLSRVRVPRLCPEVASWRLRRCNMHVDHAMLTPNEMDAMPSQREGQLDDDADYQTAYQSARIIAVNGGLR